MQPLWKTVWRVLKKLKIKVSYNPATPVSVLFLKKRKTLTRKDICTLTFIVALFTLAETWNNLCSQMDEWIKKT